MMFLKSLNTATRSPAHFVLRRAGINHTLWLLLVGTVFTLSASPIQNATTAASAQKARKLLNETLKAMGGPALTGAKDLTLSFTISSYTPQGQTSYEMVNQYARPDKIRQTTKFDFGELIVGYDGSAGWVKNPEGVQELAPSQVEETRGISLWILYDILQNIGGKEYSFEYGGKAGQPSAAVHEVVVRHRTLKEPVRIVIDDKTKRITKKIVKRQGPEGLIDVEELLSDYRTINGVQVPFAITYQTSSFKIGDIVVKEATINSGLSPSLFKKPSL